jgi:hypothetical protein
MKDSESDKVKRQNEMETTTSESTNDKLQGSEIEESEELLDQNVPLPPTSSLQREEWMLAPPKRNKPSQLTTNSSFTSSSSPPVQESFQILTSDFI